MKPLKIIYYVSLGAIALLAVLLIFSTFPIPGNFKIFVVQSGSMQPAIKLGSVVAVKPAPEYQKGEIISFNNVENPKNIITHRIFEVKEEKGALSYITKGDANEEPDERAILGRDVIGKVLFSIPFIGYGVAATRQPAGFILLIILPATLIIYDEIRKIKDEVVKMRSKKALFFILVVSVSLMTFNFTKAYLADTETSTGNIFQVTTWGVWKVTEKGEFEAGTLSNVDTTTSPGDVMLTRAYPVEGDTVALWHLNEGSGLTADDETGNNNGTLNGNAGWVDGKYNKALEFDGDGDYVEASDSASLDITGNITVEAWVKADTWDNPGAPYNVRNIVDKGEHKTMKAYGLYSYNEKLHFRVNTDTRCDAFGDLPSLGEWHHVAGTYSGSEVKVYVDNAEIGSVSCSGSIQTNDEPIYIGGGVDRNYWFDGIIDEVRISKTAKTSFPIDYFSPGTLESQVFDAGEGNKRDWNKLDWVEDTTAAGTDLSLEVATSDNGSDWSLWQLASNDVSVGIDLTSLTDSRYIKWKATLTTTDPSKTPKLEEVRVRHFASP